MGRKWDREWTNSDDGMVFVGFDEEDEDGSSTTSWYEKNDYLENGDSAFLDNVTPTPSDEEQEASDWESGEWDGDTEY